MRRKRVIGVANSKLFFCIQSTHSPVPLNDPRASTVWASPPARIRRPDDAVASVADRILAWPDATERCPGKTPGAELHPGPPW